MPWSNVLAACEIESDSADRRLNQLRRLFAGTGLILLAATWRLWTPQAVFPQVPLLRWGQFVPESCDWLGLGVLIATLAYCVVAPSSAVRSVRVALVSFVVTLACMVVTDQHRLQPWAYQFAIVAVVLAACGRGGSGSRVQSAQFGLFLLRAFTISIYFHSALSKLDFSYLQSHGQHLVSALLQVFGLPFEQFPPAVKWAAAGMLPAAELATAIMLCFPKFRRWGLAASILMHVLLLIALSPWGLAHKPGVLIWNVYFILKNVLLFSSGKRTQSLRQAWLSGMALATGTRKPAASAVPLTSNPSDSTSPNRRIRSCRSVAATTVGLAMLLPLLEPFGYFDHWPAWALYASRQERVVVEVHESRRNQLVQKLPQLVAPPQFDNPWCMIRIDRWSLNALETPIYPQGRFQLGVALALARRHQLETDIRVVYHGPANRWSGHRDQRIIEGTKAIAAEAARFWLNAQPRGERQPGELWASAH